MGVAGLSREDAIDENADDSRARRLRILARTEEGEVAEGAACSADQDTP